MTSESSSPASVIRLPVQPPQSAASTSVLIERLVQQFGATWVDESNLERWAAAGGDRVLLFVGDPNQFPEGLDVAVVLPEIQRSLPGRFEIGVVRREHEAALARRFGSQRWPTLLFLREGHYVTTVSGMHDWDVFIERVQQALSMPVSRAPTIGIPVVSATPGSASCH